MPGIATIAGIAKLHRDNRRALPLAGDFTVCPRPASNFSERQAAREVIAAARNQQYDSRPEKN